MELIDELIFFWKFDINFSDKKSIGDPIFKIGFSSCENKDNGRKIIPADIKPIPEINFLLVVFLFFNFLIIFIHPFNDVHSYQ